ncbi:hypothetical protein BGZ76_000614 [Entomortierella beljakovae]|nr:hypothetical protein BGZ76_000614 [Entomortierella beljakovae]
MNVSNDNIEDVLIIVKQSTRNEVKKKCRFELNFDIRKGVNINLCCHKSKRYVYIILKGKDNDTALDTFEAVNIIGTQGRVHSIHSISEPFATFEASILRPNATDDGKYSFKILLQSKSDPVHYNKGELYSPHLFPPKTIITVDLKPDGTSPPSVDVSIKGPGLPQKDGLPRDSIRPENSRSSADPNIGERVQDSKPSKNNHAELLSHPCFPEQEKVVNKSTHSAKSHRHRDIIPAWFYEDSTKDLLSKQEIARDPPRDDPYDVHFVHCDQDQCVNIIGAHRRVLKEYPRLDFLVESAEITRKNVKTEIGIRNINCHMQLVQAPIIVDISFVSLPAFRALMIYIYTKSIDSILDNIPGMAVTISTIVMEYMWTPGVICIADGGRTVLSMDLVLILAYSFGVVKLYEAFSRLLLYSLASKNAIAILVHTAEIEDFKTQAMHHIKKNFDCIFGHGKILSVNDFEEFENKELCVALKEEIEVVMALDNLPQCPTRYPKTWLEFSLFY